MQGHRRIARLSATAVALVLALAVAAAPAEAQRRPGGGGHPGGGRPGGAPEGGGRPQGSPLPPPPPEEPNLLAPIPLFRNVCLGGGLRLSRRDASAVTVAQVPPDARRALTETVASGPLRGDVPPIGETDTPNLIYQMTDSETYLLVPSQKAAPGAALADSCAVAWRGDDYLEARKVLFPGDTDMDLPLTARPSSHPNGAISAKTSNDAFAMSVAAYNGWVVLRSIPLTPPAPPAPPPPPAGPRPGSR